MNTAQSKYHKDDYSALLQKYPLRPIRTKREHKRAVAVCDELTDRASKLSEDERDYLSVLSNLLVEYEESSESEEEREEQRRLCSPREMVRFLMESSRLTQADLSPEFGAASRVSDFLNGKRDLSKSQIQKLAARFRVSPSLFIHAVPPDEEFKPIRQLIMRESAVTYPVPESEDAGEVRVNFRWTAEALSRVKKIAEAMGVPYQAYIKQVIYRQVLSDEKQLGCG